MRRKVVITNQDTFIEWNLTRIIKSFYPLLDDLQVSILAEDLKKDGDWDFIPDEIQDYMKTPFKKPLREPFEETN